MKSEQQGPLIKRALKIAVVGDAGVGKTSLIRWWKEGRFEGCYDRSLGMCVVNIEKDKSPASIDFYIIPPYSEEVKSYDSYVFSSDKILLVLDLSLKEDGLAKARTSWLARLNRMFEGAAAKGQEISVTIFYNKSDLNKNPVKYDEKKLVKPEESVELQEPVKLNRSNYPNLNIDKIVCGSVRGRIKPEVIFPALACKGSDESHDLSAEIPTGDRCLVEKVDDDQGSWQLTSEQIDSFAHDLFRDEDDQEPLQLTPKLADSLIDDSYGDNVSGSGEDLASYRSIDAQKAPISTKPSTKRSYLFLLPDESKKEQDAAKFDVLKNEVIQLFIDYRRPGKFQCFPISDRLMRILTFHWNRSHVGKVNLFLEKIEAAGTLKGLLEVLNGERDMILKLADANLTGSYMNRLNHAIGAVEARAKAFPVRLQPKVSV